MPIYEYQCHNCGYEFEKIQGWSDGAPACSTCGSENVGRRLSPPAIHFKGSGWYITDSKNGKGKNGATSAAGGNGASKEGEEKSSAKDGAAESGAEKSTTASETKAESPANKETSKATASA